MGQSVQDLKITRVRVSHLKFFQPVKAKPVILKADLEKKIINYEIN